MLLRKWPYRVKSTISYNKRLHILFLELTDFNKNYTCIVDWTSTYYSLHSLHYYLTSICFFRFPHDDVSALITALDLEQSLHWKVNLKFSSQLSILKNFSEVIRKDFDQFVDLTREKFAIFSVHASAVIGVELIVVIDSASITDVLAQLFFTSMAGSWEFVQVSTFPEYFVILGILKTHDSRANNFVLVFLAYTITAPMHAACVTTAC